MSKRKIPFITTNLITDIQLSFLLLPFWWVIGIEQFIWPVLTLIMTIKLFLYKSKQKQNNKITLSLIHILIIVFLGLFIISGFFIVESYRYISFIRNFVVYLSAFLIFFITTSIVKDKKDILKIIKSLVLLIFFVSLLGIFAQFNILNVHYKSPMQFIFPEFIKNTRMGQHIISRSFHINQWFHLIKRWIRRPGVFFYNANYLAAALLILIPLNILLLKHSKSRNKNFWYFSLVISLICFILTLSRGAFAGLLMGIPFFLFLKMFSKRKHRNNYFLPVTVNCVVIFIVLISILFQSTIVQLSSRYLHARDPSDRIKIYTDTLNSWKESPFFGWGAQRDIEAKYQPTGYHSMGSHSTYLGILYQHGIFALIIYLLIIFYLFKKIFNLVKTESSPFLKNFGICAGLALFMNLIHSAVTGMDLDVTTFHLIWLNWGFIIAASRLSEKRVK